MSDFPRGYLAAGWNSGIKDTTLDFGVIYSEAPAAAAAVFTRNNFPGKPVVVGREHIAGGVLQAIVVNSKNSNVATGDPGLMLAREMCSLTAESLGIETTHVLPSSTGVIGRLPPIEKIHAACREAKARLRTADFHSFADAIRTTDKTVKLASRTLGNGVKLTIAAKGAGMIEPNMATMLVYAVTDAKIDAADLRRMLPCVANRSFNRITVDSDTSTSDTFVIMANGVSGHTIKFPDAAKSALDSDLEFDSKTDLPGLDANSNEFYRTFVELSQQVSRSIVSDGEGATKILEVRITEARSKDQALKIARSIANSPLIKTAIHGGDPNWGRIIMAVGKVFDEPVPFENLKIYFGDVLLEMTGTDQLPILQAYLKKPQIVLRVSLGLGKSEERVWGCDLSREYISINADYTT
ncbi:MAG: bifunctional glutamate N-acetyltransferase/amino-acid acetyltransferase ArgJ [Spirochaetia bacterium]|nr:bifunctional glutamate N-acetyltransferase/amino-acid acetyltransferase ArgJ [Spirochaetia bacterium]